MRRFFLAALAILSVNLVFAQTDSIVKVKPAIVSHASDHFMIQLGATSWSGAPDSVHTKGIGKAFNMYIMLDFPFKTNPHFSVAIGPGISTDNIGFDRQNVGIIGQTPTLRFQNVADTLHFRKYRLNTAYLEAPVELRYHFNQYDEIKSWKLALGVKVGTLLNAHVKGVDLQNSSGTTLNSYTMKQSSKFYFNSTRVSGMFRVGYGHFSLYGSYAFTPLFKEGVAAHIRPFTIGLTISGL